MFNGFPKLALLSIISFTLGQSTEAARNPNIVFIMADDLGYADAGFNGSKWFETPRLDRLAAQSLTLDKAYMYPTCSPSRAALLTGRQSFRTGVYNVPVLERGNARDNIFSRWTVELRHKIYAEPLRDAGYKSIHVGKWHIVGPDPLEELQRAFPLKKKLRQPDAGNFKWVVKHKSPAVQRYYPVDRGFDENIGGTWRGDPAMEKGGYKSVRGGYIAPFENPFIEQREDDKWLTDRLTDEALDFMRRSKDHPFFVNLHYYAPHRPTVRRSEELFQKYMQKAGDPVTGQGVGKNRDQMAAYATMVESIDQNVGRIIDYLEQAGLRQHTIIIFTSDNGFNALQSRNNTLRGAKGHVYEGGLRVPALINWPGKIRARRSDVPISGLDYFPTFLELAGISDYAELLDGNSLVPMFASDSGMKQRTLYWHIASRYKNPPCSILLENNWKLIQFFKDGAVELYNLKDDPQESKNLASKEPRIAEELRGRLEQWRKKHKAPLPPSSRLEF